MVRLLLLSFGMLLSISQADAQKKYVDYQDAFTQGVNHSRAGRLTEAREPLEAALTLAKTDREKLDTHQALMIPYRELQEIEPMQKSGEYIILHTTHTAGHSLYRSNLLGFFNKRGKLNEAIKDYEARLEKKADDRLSLFMLTEAYGRYRNNPTKSVETGEKLIAVEAKEKIPPHIYGHADIARQMVLAKSYTKGAELFEKLAGLDQALAAWHYKEAAQAWLKADDKVKALAAAKKSSEATPEKRAQLDYYWRDAMGDIYVKLGDPATAMKHYEEAIKATKFDANKKSGEKKLAEAKAAAGK